MGRVYAEIKTKTQSLWTLFDTGARKNYIAGSAANNFPRQRTDTALQVAIGGRHRDLVEYCIIDGTLEGKHVIFQAWVIDDLGKDEKDRPLEALFGAVEMQGWSIFPIPHEERLDLSHYPDEFIEY